MMFCDILMDMLQHESFSVRLRQAREAVKQALEINLPTEADRLMTVFDRNLAALYDKSIDGIDQDQIGVFNQIMGRIQGMLLGLSTTQPSETLVMMDLGGLGILAQAMIGTAYDHDYQVGTNIMIDTQEFTAESEGIAPLLVDEENDAENDADLFS